MQPNIDALKQHLEFLFDNMQDYQDGFIEISILDQSENFALNEIDKAVARAVQWNSQGKNVYTVGSIMLPTTAPFGRNKDIDFYATNVLWCDIDNHVDPQDLKARYKDCPPSLVVVTGRTPHIRTHLWWKLDEAITDAQTLRTALTGLQQALGGDPAAKNPSRLMRLGGSVAWPKKDGRIVELTEVATPQSASITSIDAIMRQYAPVNPPQKSRINLDLFKKSTLNLSDQWSETDIRRLLDYIDPDIDYHNWFQIGMALKDYNMPFSVWDDWSRRGAKYNNAEMAVKWNSFKGSGVTIGTLVHMAKEGGWQPKRVDEIVSLPQKPAVNHDPVTGEIKEPVADGEKKAEVTPFHWLEASEIKPVIDVADFVEGTLRDGEMSVIYGRPNCGKTFFMVDLSLHVALGREWNGREIEQGAVVYVSMEGASGIRNRITAFKQHYYIIDNIPMVVIPQAFSMMNATDPVNFLATLSLIEAKHGRVRMIVIDTLARAMAGGDENSTKDMSVFVANCDAIRQQTTAHMAIIHHSGKDDTRGARGSSALLGGIDTEIELKRDNDSRIVTVSITKQREMEAGTDLFYQLETVALGVDRRGKPVTSCVVLPVSGDDVKGKKKNVKLLPEHELVFNSLRNTLAHKAQDRHVLADMKNVTCVTREEFRSELVSSGFYSEISPETAKYRLRDILNSLKQKGVCNFTATYIWIPQS